MAKTKIEWVRNTDGTQGKTWNPVTGCTPTSDGCSHCYAHRMSKRLAGRCGYPADDPFKVTLHPERLELPKQWKKPRKIFVNSMSDIFHEDIPRDYLYKIWAVMLEAKRHTFMILTKRAYPMFRLVDSCEEMRPASNIWMGVSAENQKCADLRIPFLLKTPAAVRFVSVEPMLSAVDLMSIDTGFWLGEERKIDCESCSSTPVRGQSYCPGHDAGGIHFVIAGCESGPNRRLAKTEWFINLKNQCIEANVPFFLKQMDIDGKLVKMPELEGRTWAQFPQTTD